MRILLDGMGGDNAPSEIVKGAVGAAEVIHHDIAIIGRKADIRTELEKYEYDKNQIEIVNANDVITNDDSPVKAVRKKTDSSLVVAMNMLRNGAGDLLVSAGNTGAIVVAGRMILGKIKEIDRPCLASIYPIMGSVPSLLIDAGANAECRPRNLLQQGAMGSIYVEKVFGRKSPKVGLVNIGVEEGKGTETVKKAHRLLKESNMNFIGNVEAREIPTGVADVIVCDGFTGNVIIKLTEGFATNIFQSLKEKFLDGVRAKLGAALLKNNMVELRKEFDYSEYGGAPILGINGPVIKMHGSSEANAVKNAIIRGVPFAEEKVIDLIGEEVRNLEKIIEE